MKRLLTREPNEITDVTTLTCVIILVYFGKIKLPIGFLDATFAGEEGG